MRLPVQDVRESLRRPVPTHNVGGTTPSASIHESLRRQSSEDLLRGHRSLRTGCREGTINLERIGMGQRRMRRRLKRTSAVEREDSVEEVGEKL